MFKETFSLIEFIPPIHREGLYFIIIFALATLILFFLSNKLGTLGLIITIGCALFFRDPVRISHPDPNLVLSPADGIITKIEQVAPPKQLALGSQTMTRVSIFLSVFDVHVNRMPINGTVQKTYYHPGAFLNASLDKASEHNERQLISLKSRDGSEFAVVQIAGLIARRIVCDVSENDEVQAGSKFGIIRFGSRVDLYLPTDLEIKVLTGQRMIGGETIIADVTQTKEDDDLREE